MRAAPLLGESSVAALAETFKVLGDVTRVRILDALARDFERSGYDLKHLVRSIMNSRSYQLSAVPNETVIPVPPGAATT